MNHSQYYIKRVVIIQFFILLLSTGSYAINVEETEKRENEKAENSKKESNSGTLEDKKVDSLTVLKKPITEINSKIKSTSYNSELYMEEESLNKSGSVITFNFIQYMIQNFKFSEEMF